MTSTGSGDNYLNLLNYNNINHGKDYVPIPVSGNKRPDLF
jgi:hypothetical protein